MLAQIDQRRVLEHAGLFSQLEEAPLLLPGVRALGDAKQVWRSALAISGTPPVACESRRVDFGVTPFEVLGQGAVQFRTQFRRHVLVEHFLRGHVGETVPARCRSDERAVAA